jgi:hypothetical protein
MVMRVRHVFAFIVLAAGTALARSQNPSSGVYLSQAFERVTESAAGAAKLGNFGYHEGISVIGAWVDCRDSVTFTIPLKAGANYMFAAGGDNDAQNVDLEIQDAAGKTLAKETREAPDAMVTYTPDADGRYTLKLTLAKSRQDLVCFCVACILKEDGYKVPQGNLNDCANKMLKLFGEQDKVLQRSNKQLALHRQKNQWAVFGALLDPVADISVTNLELGVGRRIFLGLGDKNTQDVDLFLLDNASKTIAKDTSVSDVAIVDYYAGQGRYGVKMLNYKGSGRAVVLSGIFDVIPR